MAGVGGSENGRDRWWWSPERLCVLYVCMCVVVGPPTDLSHLTPIYKENDVPL